MAAKPTINFEDWDKEFYSKTCNLEQLQLEMINVSRIVEDVEVLWRLSRVTYQISLNHLEEEVIKAKTIEAFKYADKAYQLNANHFQANKWIATAAGKLALLETAVAEKIKYITAFMKHMKICVEHDPNDQMVLFMQGRFQLALFMLSEDEQKLIREYMGVLPVADVADAEAKLRKSIELNPNFIDSYITLAYLLIKNRKIQEAKVIVEKGLKVEQVTKSDYVIGKELEKIKESIG